MVSRQHVLPGPVLFARRALWSSSDRLITAIAVAIPAALFVDGLFFNDAIAWVGAGATAATATFLLTLWSLETRDVAVGEGWLAVRARLAPTWIVVPCPDIVGVARRRIVRSGLAVRITSGPPVFLRRADLQAGVAEAMRQHLGLVISSDAAVAQAIAEAMAQVTDNGLPALPAAEAPEAGLADVPVADADLPDADGAHDQG